MDLDGQVISAREAQTRGHRIQFKMRADRRPAVGILGGGGPAAAAHLHSLLIGLCQEAGACDDLDFPPILVWNWPLPAMNEYGFVAGLERDLEVAVLSACQSLQAAGVSVILPACNTIAAFHDRTQACLEVPLIHLPREACRRAAEEGWRRIGVLTSRTSRELDIYGRCGSEYGLDVMYPRESVQRSIDNLIRAAMGGAGGPDQLRELEEIASALMARGADAVVLGCSELSVLGSRGGVEFPIVDSLQLSAQAALKGRWT